MVTDEPLSSEYVNLKKPVAASAPCLTNIHANLSRWGESLFRDKVVFWALFDIMVDLTPWSNRA